MGSTGLLLVDAVSRQIVEELYGIVNRAAAEGCVYGDGWRAVQIGSRSKYTDIVVWREPAGWRAAVDLLSRLHCTIQLSASLDDGSHPLVQLSTNLCYGYQLDKIHGLCRFQLGRAWLELPLWYILNSYEGLEYGLSHGWEDEE